MRACARGHSGRNEGAVKRRDGTGRRWRLRGQPTHVMKTSLVEKHVQRGLVKCNAYLREQGYDMSEFGAATKDAAKSSPLIKPKPLTKLAEQVESSDE